MKLMETIHKEIDGIDFYLKPFPAFTAANISGELISILAPVIGSLAPALSNDGQDGETEEQGVMDMDIAEAVPHLANAFSKLDGNQFENIMKKLLVTHKNISVEDPNTGSVKVLDMDAANEIFCGDLQNMFILCFEVIKLNYGGFFKKIGDRFGSLRDMVDKVTPNS